VTCDLVSTGSGKTFENWAWLLKFSGTKRLLTGEGMICFRMSLVVQKLALS
jgi:hypothetical protein